MSTITIHGLPLLVEEKLRKRAKQKNQSINQTVKDLLEVSLAPGYSAQKRAQNKEMFAEFFGTWSKKEAKAFDEAIADFEKIHPEDWK